MLEASDISTKLDKDCVLCRVWAGAFHIAASFYVASYWRKQAHPAGKAVVLSFSAGKTIRTTI